MPEALEGAVGLGSVVRVPLRGRRERGWVVGFPEQAPVERLGVLAGVSGAGPVFDEPLLGVARALARFYVHPLSSFLRLLTPPQMGRAMSRRAAPGVPVGPPVGATAGARGLCVLRRLDPREDAAGLYGTDIARTLASGRGVIAVVPEVREGSRLVEQLASAFPDDVAVVHSGQSPVERSRALWSVARGKRRLVVGGRGAALVPAMDLGLVVVHDEADFTLKAQSSPYADARVAGELRAAAAGATLLLASTGPSLRSWHRAATSPGWRYVEPPRDQIRAGWPVVELVEPARTVLPRRIVAAVQSAAHSGSRVLVLVPRLHATPAGPGPAEVAGYLQKVAPAVRVARVDPGGPGLGAGEDPWAAGIVVATEGALADLDRPAVPVAVALGVDALLHRPHGRAAEEAFSTLWGLACLAARTGGGTGRPRVLLETAEPGHHVVQAVVRGDYAHFADRELAARRETASPPVMSLIRVRASGSAMGQEVVDDLGRLPGTEVLGPVEGRLGAEVLLKVASREAVLDPLRTLVAGAGERLLVEVDPRDW